MVLAAIGGIFIGLPIAIGSIFTGSCLFILYNGIVMLKFCGLLEMVCFVFFCNLQETDENRHFWIFFTCSSISIFSDVPIEI